MLTRVRKFSRSIFASREILCGDRQARKAANAVGYTIEECAEVLASGVGG
jgi:hypothetical protein